MGFIHLLSPKVLPSSHEGPCKPQETATPHRASPLPRYFISHKPNKTWQQVFWFAVSIAVNNAYILYKMSDAYHVKKYSRAQFGERLVRELLGLEDSSPAH